jgi:nicotinamide-nucleotide amidase
MDELQRVAQEISAAAQSRGRTVAAAESVTAGSIATALASAGEASEWFRGSIVAYQTVTKRHVLGVESDAVITPRCAREMAEGAVRVTGADLVVSVTGVGGPDPEEDRPPGTVFICAGSDSDLRVYDHLFDGSPEQVVRQATLFALRHLHDAALELDRGAR